MTRSELKLRSMHPGPAYTAPLAEPTLFYDPPYERPLEDEFAWHLVKYLQPISGLLYQEKVETPCVDVWLDFVVELDGRRVGFEITDLEEDADPEQERLRAALVLGSGRVDVLYRLRGADVLYRLHDALQLVAAWEPALFSHRGRVNLATLASPAARACRPQRGAAEVRVPMTPEPLADDVEALLAAEPWPAPPAELVVQRLDRGLPGAWMADYERALQQYGVTDDDLGAGWARSA